MCLCLSQEGKHPPKYSRERLKIEDGIESKNTFVGLKKSAENVGKHCTAGAVTTRQISETSTGESDHCLGRECPEPVEGESQGSPAASLSGRERQIGHILLFIHVCTY